MAEEAAPVFDDPHHTLTHLVRIAQGLSPEEGKAWLGVLFEQDLERWAVPALDVAVETGDPVGQVLASYLKANANLELALRIGEYCHLPDHNQSVPLRELALVATTRAADLMRQEAKSGSTEDILQLAWTLNNLSIRLVELGDVDGSIETLKESLELKRYIPTSDDRLRSMYVASTEHNLACNQDDPRSALLSSQKAVCLYRNLAKQGPHEFNPDLAMSLNTLSNNLFDNGYLEQAILASREAVELAEQSYTGSLETLLLLAITEATLATKLRRRGHMEEALGLNRKAVERFQLLASIRPDSFLPQLATSLGNLGICLADLDRFDETLVAYSEAIRLWRSLTSERPTVFGPKLAGELASYASALLCAGRCDEALAACQEVVRMAERAEPDDLLFLPHLAMGFQIRGDCLVETGASKEALEAHHRAVALWRQVAAKQPVRYLPDLAEGLTALAFELSCASNLDEALRTLVEAAQIYRKMVPEQQEVYADHFAYNLDGVADVLRQLGRYDEALASNAESIGLYRQLVAHRGEALLPELATSLGLRCQILSDALRLKEAFDTAEEALRIVSPHFRRHPTKSLRTTQLLLYDYTRLAEAEGFELNMHLLEPLLHYLETIEGQGVELFVTVEWEPSDDPAAPNE